MRPSCPTLVLAFLLLIVPSPDTAIAQGTGGAGTDPAAGGVRAEGATGGETGLRGLVQRRPAIPDDARVEGASQGDAPLSAPATVGSSLNRIGRSGGTAATEAGASATNASRDPSSDTTPGGSGVEAPRRETGSATGTTPVADSDAAPLEALRRVIEDPDTRAKLLGALAALEGNAPSGAGDTAAAEAASAEAGGGGGPAAAAGSAEAEQAAEGNAETEAHKRSLGRRIAELTQEGVEEIVHTVKGFVTGVHATLRRLTGFADVDAEELMEIAHSIAITFVSTFATFLLLRVLARPLWLRLGRFAENASYAKTGLVILLSAVIDVGVVLLAWAVGYGLALFGWGTPGQIDIHEALFLNAFLVVELVKAFLRVLIAPTTGRLRPLPLSDGAAVYWHLWSTALVSLLGYGLMLVVPIVNDVVNIFTGRATSVLIFTLFLVIAMILAIVNRRAPTEYFRDRRAEEGGDVTLGVIAAVAPFFPYAVIAYLFTLFVFAVASTGQVGAIVLDTLKVLGIIGLGWAAVSVLSAASKHGVKLPSRVTDTLPLLERRLNTFVPAFLSIVRFVVFLAVIGAAIEVTGLFDVTSWLDDTLGGDATATVVSVVLIVIAAFLVWLALSSWIEYRLTPRGFRVVTSREQTLLTLLWNAASIGIIVIAAMFSLSELGINIAPLIASAGVLGLAIGFGAQKLVQDIITGIFIQFENACNVGDVIAVGGTTGTVEKLTIRSVSLRDLDGTFHVIPFSSVDMVSNYMRGFAYHVADLGIAYREDTDVGKQVMLDCFGTMKQDPDWQGKIIGDLEWFGVQSLGDSAVVLRARIKVRPGQQWGIGRRYNELLKKACDERGIEIPFPHMTVWMGEGKDGGAPPLHMRAEGGVAPKRAEGAEDPDAPTGTGAEKTRKPASDAPLDDEG
ncbi:MAG: mechanosensitive ion channel domain-containing protein [Pseudomonadota bacterium]